METIKIKNKKIVIKEPTIRNWTNVMKLKEALAEEELNIRMIQELTDLTYEEVIEIEASKIAEITNIVSNYFIKDSKLVFNEFEFEGNTYKLVDVYNISFGQFVDIDTFLGKSEEYRINNLNELAAYLYCESGMKYSDSNFQKRIRDFEELPIKYVDGAVFFLTTLGRALSQASVLYSQSKWRWRILKLLIHLASIGAGIKQFLSLLVTGLKKLMRLLTYPLSHVSTTLLTLLTLKKKKRKR